MASTVKEVVVFGPYLGELGHEVRAWAPYVRHCISELPKGQTPIVISKPGHSVLYPTGVRYIPFDLIELRPSDFMATSVIPSALDLRRITDMQDAIGQTGNVFQQIQPGRSSAYALGLQPRKSFQLLIPPPSQNQYRVGVFVRDKQDVGADRNLGREFWNEAIEYVIPKMLGELHFIFMGQTPGNLVLADFEPLRSEPRRCWCSNQHGSGEYSLGDTVHALRLVNVVWGESSGPMHLALGPCQRDVVVCCESQEIADRYIKEDNWFDRRVKTCLRKDLTPATWADALVEMVRA